MVPSGVGGQRPMFGMVPVTTTSIHHQQNHLMIPQVSVKHEPMDSSHSVINTRVTANLYLCDSGKGINWPFDVMYNYITFLFY